MNIEYINGNLLETDCNVICHGCNAKGVMGSGVALAIKEKYPWAYEEYRKEFDEFTKTNFYNSWPGEVVLAAKDGLLIMNMITQTDYGRIPGMKYVSYDAIDKCTQWIKEFCENSKIDTIAMPKIGAGLGGGCWEIIENIIKQNIVKYGIKVKVYVI